MRVNKIGVHVTHCCIVHGCKYGDKDCPVVIATHKQEYLCELCTDVYERMYNMNDINKIFIKENRKIKIKKIQKDELYSS
jgi:hypothetical protein